MKQATFIALASILTTACGTDTEISKENEQNHEEVKIQLESQDKSRIGGKSWIYRS